MDAEYILMRQKVTLNLASNNNSGAETYCQARKVSAKQAELELNSHNAKKIDT
jgi:hypothetical protein